MAPRRRIGEFELIARYFAPLARAFKGAGNLQSDNAFLAADPRRDLVVKTDTIVAGVHFLADDLPQRVAAKALRVTAAGLPPIVSCTPAPRTKRPIRVTSILAACAALSSPARLRGGTAMASS